MYFLLYTTVNIQKKKRIGFYWGNLINNLQFLKAYTNIGMYYNDICSSIYWTGL
jgi:hypothetical protein